MKPVVFFITAEGKVLTSGSNKDGIAGLGDNILYTDTIQEVPILRNVKDIATSPLATYFILENGQVYCSGVGIRVSKVPVLITELQNIAKISIDNESLIALDKLGDVYIYGDNSFGQLGGGSLGNYSKITKLAGVRNVKDVSMGDKYSVFLFHDGSIRTTGYDLAGRLGLNNIKATVVKTLTGLKGNYPPIKEIAAGKTHILYLSNDNILYVTGIHSGNNNSQITEITGFMTNIEGLSVSKIGACDSSFVLLSDNTVWTAGYNYYGADFSGSGNSNLNEYVKVADEVLDIFIGGNQTFMGKKNGDIVAAGKNHDGEIPIGTHGGNIFTPVVLQDMYYMYGSRGINSLPEVTTGTTKIRFIFAVLADKTIELSGSGLIKGDAASNKGEVSLGYSTPIQGNLYVGKGVKRNIPNTSMIKGVVNELTPHIEMPMPTFITPLEINNKKGVKTVGNWPTSRYEITEDSEFDELNIVSDGQVTIHAPSGIRHIKIGTLNIPQGAIKIMGSGKVYLYLDNPIFIGGSSGLNIEGRPNQLHIFIKNGGTNQILGSSVVKGMLYGSSSNLDISGSSRLEGVVVLGGTQINLGGATPLLGGLYTPNAEVRLSGSSYIKGAIVSEKYFGSGGTVVDYEDIIIDIPTDYVPPKENPPEAPIEPPKETPTELPNEGLNEPPFDNDVYDKLRSLDFELVLNVARDGDKQLGQSLGAYERMLRHVDNTANNRALGRLTKVLDIFGYKSTPRLRYGTYNLYYDNGYTL